MKNRIYLFFLLFSLHGFTDEAPTLHAFAMFDTFSTDIQRSTLQDKEEIEYILDQLSFQKIAVNRTVIEGIQFSAESVIGWVNRLYIQPYDTIFFYYSGHGVRTSTCESPWPHIFFPHRQSILSSNELLRVLQAKSPQLLIVMTDCCNDGNVIIKGYSPTSPYLLLSKSPKISSLKNKKHIASNLKHLFMKSTGTVFITAAKPGSPAMGTSDGGILTQTFIKGVKSCYKKQPISWKLLIQKMQKKAFDYHQTLYYEIDSDQ